MPLALIFNTISQIRSARAHTQRCPDLALRTACTAETAEPTDDIPGIRFLDSLILIFHAGIEKTETLARGDTECSDGKCKGMLTVCIFGRTEAVDPGV